MDYIDTVHVFHHIQKLMHYTFDLSVTEPTIKYFFEGLSRSLYMHACLTCTVDREDPLNHAQHTPRPSI